MNEKNSHWVKLDRFNFGWSLDPYIRIAVGVTQDGEYSTIVRTYGLSRKYKLSELRKVKNDLVDELVRILKTYKSEKEKHYD